MRVNNKFLFFIKILFFFFTISAFAEYDINYSTCEPKGLYSKYQFNNNPDKFYISQITSFENHLNYWDNQMIRNHCFMASNEKECLISMNKRNKEISKCLFEYKRKKGL